MIPEYTKQEIDRWVSHGTPDGSFVMAVLENDLRGAIFSADGDNCKNLKDVVKYVMWEIPAVCWGSKEAVRDWPDRLAKRLLKL